MEPFRPSTRFSKEWLPTRSQPTRTASRSSPTPRRAAGATEAEITEAEITEAVEVGYLYGGTAALVMGMNALIPTDELDHDK